MTLVVIGTVQKSMWVLMSNHSNRANKLQGLKVSDGRLAMAFSGLISTVVHPSFFTLPFTPHVFPS